MIEGIFNATAATFVSVAQANNLHVGGKLIANGVISRGGWFLSYVGKQSVPTGTVINGVPQMTELPGVWARLRINDDPPQRLLNLIRDLKAAGGKVYTLKTIGGQQVWSSDGTTPAPDYVANIGVIL